MRDFCGPSEIKFLNKSASAYVGTAWRLAKNFPTAACRKSPFWQPGLFLPVVSVHRAGENFPKGKGEKPEHRHHAGQ